MSRPTYENDGHLKDEEICNVTDFFISPLSPAVTGQVIYLGVVH